MQKLLRCGLREFGEKDPFGQAYAAGNREIFRGVAKKSPGGRVRLKRDTSRIDRQQPIAIESEELFLGLACSRVSAPDQLAKARSPS